MSTTEQEVTGIPTGTYQADVVHSSVDFEVQYMGIATFSGGVKEFQASLADGRLDGSARIATLVTKDENLLGHLLAPDFFDAEQFPEVGFSGQAVQRVGDEVVFQGEITIKGVTKPATLTGTITGPVTDPRGNERYGLKLQTTVDRTEFGITWNSDLPNGQKALADDVTLKAELSLVQQA
jgi:polyisoprenoid-binding protein YceI